MLTSWFLIRDVHWTILYHSQRALRAVHGDPSRPMDYIINLSGPVLVTTHGKSTKVFFYFSRQLANELLVYSVQIRDVGRFLAKFNPWTNTFGNRLVRLHCSRIHPSVKLSTPKVYSCRIVENKRFELLKMNLTSPDTLFEICTYMYLKHVRVS